MSILDRKFILDLYVKPPPIIKYDNFIKYLENNIGNLLTNVCLMFYHFEGSGFDKTLLILYNYQDKYIVIHVCCGTCSGCLKICNNQNDIDLYNSLIDRSIETAYVTTNLNDALKYYKQKSICIEPDTDFYYKEPLFKEID